MLVNALVMLVNALLILVNAVLMPGLSLMKWMIFKNHPPSKNQMDDGSKWTANYWDDARMTTFLV